MFNIFKFSQNVYFTLGKALKLWKNRTNYILPKTYKYPDFTATITVNPEKTPGQYMCQLLWFYSTIDSFTVFSTNSSVWNSNKSTGLEMSMTVWTFLAMATALFVYF